MARPVKFPRAHPTLFAVGILFEVMFSLESEDRKRKIADRIASHVARYEASADKADSLNGAKNDRVLRKMRRALSWVERFGRGLAATVSHD